MNIKFKKLNNSIIKCKKCPRLIKFSKKISTVKRKLNIKEVYWGKPVPGFGDSNAKLMIIGLAPAAHGGTRTGRAFTGDKSGDFLFYCLNKAGISSLPRSTHINDGLKLNKTYITNILKCVPPNDKPLGKELNNCSDYFDNEIQNLVNLKVIITLGKIAFDNCIKFYKKNFIINEKLIFKHGVKYHLPDGKILIPSYHPSPRNVNTKIINIKKLMSLLKIAKKYSKL
jgi:uracil-DNA glycosylase family 4